MHGQDDDDALPELDEPKIRECLDNLLGSLGDDLIDSSHVTGPALAVMLTELAVADGMDVETLVEVIRAQYKVATGDLFRKWAAAHSPYSEW